MNPRYEYAGVNMRQKNISRTQKSFLNLAQKAAGASECVQRHGAVVVRAGSVLSIGVNKWRNDVTLANEMMDDGRSADVSVHAEIDALSRVGNPVGATIYIARINKSGEARLSKPCNRCAEAIKEAGITKVVYTTHD
jgi:deoxycytidylate deaminase